MCLEGVFIIFWFIQGSGGAPGAPWKISGKSPIFTNFDNFDNIFTLYPLSQTYVNIYWYLGTLGKPSRAPQNCFSKSRFFHSPDLSNYLKILKFLGGRQRGFQTFQIIYIISRDIRKCFGVVLILNYRVFNSIYRPSGPQWPPPPLNPMHFRPL